MRSISLCFIISLPFVSTSGFGFRTFQILYYLYYCTSDKVFNLTKWFFIMDSLKKSVYIMGLTNKLVD